jgi:hypothetical protein
VLFSILLAATACGDDASSFLSPTSGPAVSRQSADATVRIEGATPSLAVGQTAQLRVSTSGGGLTPAALRRQPPVWRSSDATALSVDTTGLVRALRAGVGVTVTVATSVGTASVQINTTAAPVVAPPTTDSIVGPPVTDTTTQPAAQTQTPVVPAASASVALGVTRFDGGSGSVLVSNAIPLRAGMLRATDVRNVHIFVGNTEQPVYVEPLRGRHADGSLRTVLVQWRYTMSGTATVPATFTIGAARTLPDLAKPTEGRGVPAAAALPTSADYLVSTDIVGPTVTAAAAAGVPGVAKWDETFRTGGDWHWANEADAWGANYYDRAHSYYAMWARTGNPVYWHRGARIAVGYRTGYIEAYNGATPHWSQAVGLLRHYQLTGDDASRAALKLVADKSGWWVVPSHLGTTESVDVENRIRARMLQLQHALWQLAETDAERAPFAQTIDAMLNFILPAQSTDGGWRVQIACGQTMNYMDGMLMDVFIDLHDNYRADPRLVAAVRKSADYLWTQYQVAAGGMKYLSAPCANVGGTEVVPVLNNLAVNAFAWSYARGAGSIYRDRADQMFVGAVNGMTPTNGKEFNQLYNTAYRYLAYRR